jgi:hypothetical protein
MAKLTKAREFWNGHPDHNDEEFTKMCADLSKVSRADPLPEGAITPESFKETWGFSTTVARQMKDGTYGSESSSKSSSDGDIPLRIREHRLTFKKRSLMIADDTYVALQRAYDERAYATKQYVLDAIIRKGLGIDDDSPAH